LQGALRLFTIGWHTILKGNLANLKVPERPKEVFELGH